MIVHKIAFRNLLEHKAKTAIIGSLIAFAIAFLVAGNSLMDSVESGMRTSYAENYTGDLIVHGLSDEAFSLISMGPIASDIPVLPAYAELRAAAEAAPSAAAVLPLLSGAASLNLDEEAAGMSFLWGVDFAEYAAMFPGSLRFLEGGFPAAEGPAIILSRTVRDEAEKEVGRRIAVGDKVTLGGFGSGGSRLREAAVAGVFEFERGGAQLERVSIVDAGTLRSLKGLSAVAAASASESSAVADGGGAAADSGIADAEISEDDLFASGDLTSSPATAAGGGEAAALDFDSILGDLSVRDKYSALDSTAWNFLLVRLSDPAAVPRAAASIESAIAAAGASAAVDGWRWGAGLVADLAYSIQVIFNVIVLIVSIVAVIIIMNTLVISVTERIPEIGTIRAIGGGKGFIRSMIVWETLSISIVFGLAGILIGAAAIGAANLAGVESSNMFFDLLFGGSVLRPSLSAGAVGWSLAATAAIGTLSSLYPTAVALKISPVKAMQKG